MKRIIILWVFSIFLFFFLVTSTSMSKEKDKGRPPGWDKGEKRSWNSDVPQGQEKKLEHKKVKKKKEGEEKMSEPEEEPGAIMEEGEPELKKPWKDLTEEERKAIFDEYKSKNK